MDREEVIRVLKELAESCDPERAHGEADDLLLAYINDPEITELYDKIEKWYA